MQIAAEPLVPGAPEEVGQLLTSVLGARLSRLQAKEELVTIDGIVAAWEDSAFSVPFFVFRREGYLLTVTER